MVRFSIPVLALCLAGCAVSRPPKSAVPAQPAYVDAPSAALVFDSPLCMAQPPIQLPREPREPAAFVAYEDLTATFFYTRTDDQQVSRHGGPWIFREAVSEKVGISYR